MTKKIITTAQQRIPPQKMVQGTNSVTYECISGVSSFRWPPFVPFGHYHKLWFLAMITESFMNIVPGTEIRIAVILYSRLLLTFRTELLEHMSIPEESESRYQTFRDCVFEAITNKSTLSNDKRTPSRRRRHSRKDSKLVSEPAQPEIPTPESSLDDPSALADFSDYLATEIFLSLPESLQTLSHQSSSTTTSNDDYSLPLTTTLVEALSTHLPPSISDTLTTYSLITPPSTDTQSFLTPIITSYITTLLTPPPPPSSTRPSDNSCELCSRTHLPLTYHHLIPKSTHARSLKRGWHKAEDLGSVAWLCRACHSFVHRMAGNEELARKWFTMERIREGEGVEEWVGWVGGVRWKKR